MDRTIETSTSFRSAMGQLCEPTIFEICHSTHLSTGTGTSEVQDSPIDHFGSTQSITRTKRISPKYFVMIGGIIFGLVLVGVAVHVIPMVPFHKMRFGTRPNVMDDDITVSIDQDEDDDSDTVEA
jgi:hypothetical protein